MDTCPYCGEEQRALKNHVRLASGDGHGPSGTYPDDFEDGTSPDPPPASQDDAEDRASGADAGEGDPSSEEGVSPSPGAEGSHSSPHDDAGSPSGGLDDAPPATADTETVEMTPEEIDEMIEAAAEAREESIREEQSKKVTLPCGHESFSPSEAPEYPFAVTCQTCGGSWRVTE